jgi:hypothetical protein
LPERSPEFKAQSHKERERERRERDSKENNQENIYSDKILFIRINVY